MENSILTQLGLDPNQILVYTFLLEHGPSKASAIAKNTPIKRGLVYKILDELVKLEIITKDDQEEAVSVFTPLHPSALKSLAESKVRQAQNTQNYLDTELGSLISIYNLTNNKPGIVFYEGLDGLKKVLDDTLKSKTDIYLFLNKDILGKKEIFNKINSLYKKKREKYGVKKKIIRVGKKQQSSHQKEVYTRITTIRYFEHALSPFNSSMQIYDNKISYQVIHNNSIVSIIIEEIILIYMY